MRKIAEFFGRGLFQFIDQTWLGLVKQFGAQHGHKEPMPRLIDQGAQGPLHGEFSCS